MEEEKHTNSIREFMGGLLLGIAFISPLQLVFTRSNLGIGSAALFWIIEAGAYLAIIIFSFFKWRHEKVYIGVIIGGALVFIMFFFVLPAIIGNLAPDNYYPGGF